MIFGYVRVSTPKQNIERQIRNILRVAPDAVMYKDYYTGTTTDGRRDWNRLMKAVKPGDIIYFDSVSRMSRNCEEGFRDYMNLLEERNVELRFLNEPHINTEHYKSIRSQAIPMTGTLVDPILEGVNKVLALMAAENIRLAFERSEAEVVDLRERTKGGIETARRSGKAIGRPGGKNYETQKSKDAKPDILKHSKTFGGSLSDKDCIRLIGISHNTYYKYKRELLVELHGGESGE